MALKLVVSNNSLQRSVLLTENLLLKCTVFGKWMRFQGYDKKLIMKDRNIYQIINKFHDSNNPREVPQFIIFGWQ
jgi:hypothetical protein